MPYDAQLSYEVVTDFIYTITGNKTRYSLKDSVGVITVSEKANGNVLYTNSEISPGGLHGVPVIDSYANDLVVEIGNFGGIYATPNDPGIVVRGEYFQLICNGSIIAQNDPAIISTAKTNKIFFGVDDNRGDIFIGGNYSNVTDFEIHGGYLWGSDIRLNGDKTSKITFQNMGTLGGGDFFMGKWFESVLEFSEGADKFICWGTISNYNVSMGGNDDYVDMRYATIDNVLVAGGFGDDTFVLDKYVELYEGQGQGRDTIEAWFSFNLTADLIKGQEIEVVKLQGVENLSATGNQLDNEISDNSGNNTLSGLAGADILSATEGNDKLLGGTGNDILVGGVGNDFLDGGAGADQLVGGQGDDTFVFDNAADQMIEIVNDAMVNEGKDTVISSFSLTLREAFENLILADTAGVTFNIKGIGNGLNNSITGNGLNNLLEGRGGADKIYGGGGRDSLKGGDGIDYLYGGTSNDDLRGDGGNDFLIGDSGGDLLYGGTGADRFIFKGAFGIDTIKDFTQGLDRIDVSSIAAISSFNDLKNNHAANTHGGLSITIGNEKIFVEGIKVEQLQSADFVI